ncbi:MAG: dihydroorotate dehydrogenase [Candidatus Omnitrophota bacterium]|nr:dihydroorotate dehydrogenase [Candidatus Omnitrophota bacterium]
MSDVNLTTKIKGLTFRNPITVGSGTFGTKQDFLDYVDYERLGAMTTKTITRHPRTGNPMPRICETSAGMLNAIGLQNRGLEEFLKNKIPLFAKIKTPLIVNIAGEAAGDFQHLAEALHKEKDVVKALELNLSCPNVEEGGAGFMRKRERILEAVKVVRDATDLPIFAKLSPELGDVVEIARDVIDVGADGLTLINTLKGMAVDTERRCSRIANITGGLSGPAIKPVAVRYVYEVKQALGVPVIASGGIMTAQDAIEFLIVGADLLAVGTANFINPRATMEILDGISQYCRDHDITHIDELRGSFHHENQISG